MGKGDKQRPSQVSHEEELLRWKLAFGKITFDEFKRQYQQLKSRGKIYRRR